MWDWRCTTGSRPRLGQMLSKAVAVSKDIKKDKDDAGEAEDEEAEEGCKKKRKKDTVAAAA
eukprot:10654116-Heterocapsa_arctica.AAC.1